jgi:hypothetical protein
MLEKLRPYLLYILATLGLILIVGGGYLAFFHAQTTQDQIVSPVSEVTTEQVDPCVIGALEAEITPCQVMVYLNPYEFADLSETQQLELIDNLMSSSNAPFTSYSLLPSKTEMMLLVNTPYGKEEEVGIQLFSEMPKYVVKYNVIEKVEVLYN